MDFWGAVLRDPLKVRDHQSHKLLSDKLNVNGFQKDKLHIADSFTVFVNRE